MAHKKGNYFYTLWCSVNLRWKFSLQGRALDSNSDRLSG